MGKMTERDAAEVRRAVARVADGETCSSVAGDLGVAPSTVWRWVKASGDELHARNLRRAKDDQVRTGARDDRDVDGTITACWEDEPPTLDDLVKKFKVDLDVWEATHFTPNEWHGWYKVPGPSHRKVKLYQAKATFKRKVPQAVEAGILAFIRSKVPAQPRTKKLKGRPEEFALSWGIFDAHLGMYAWADEVGEDFDLEIARTRVMKAIDQMCEEVGRYAIDRIWMPVGNDFLHFDGVKMTTTRGEHTLDTDTRYAKVYQTGLECLCHMVDRAAEMTGNLEVLYVPGNHDYVSSFTLCAALAQRYRKSKGVSVDLGANPRKYRRFGGTLLGFNHGNDLKPDQLARVFAQETIKDWSESTYREVQIGHRHKRWQKEYESVQQNSGITIRMHPALCGTDLWHHKQGFIDGAGRAAEAHRYDRTGFRGTHTVWIDEKK